MKVAFALIPEKGHVNPYIGPAQALSDDGHEVVIAAPGDILDQIERAGLAFCDELIDLGADNRVTRGPELIELIQDAARLAQWIEQLLLGGIPEQVTRLREWYARERVEVVVVDPLYYAAAIAAHLEELPWAAVSNSLNPVIPPELDSALLRTVRSLSARRDAIFGGYGMRAEFRGCDVLSPYLTVAFATEALTGPPPHGVRLAGPSFPLRQRGDEVELRPLPADRPVIYASFGSQIYHWPEVFEELLGAGELLGAHMAFSMGEMAKEPRWSAVAAGWDAYEYAPQLELLDRAAAFVTHGGANSVMEAAACGVPMLISPMCNDQFHQAYFIERCGIGVACDLRNLSASLIAELLHSVCNKRTAAEKIATSYRENGARKVAAWMGELCRQ